MEFGSRLPSCGLRRLAEHTPPHRDRHVDLVRAVAIAAVVLGHWLAATVTYDRGGLGGGNALEALPWAHWLSWIFQVMPLFFVVGGYANAASLRSFIGRGGRPGRWLLGRTDRLFRPTTALVVVIAALSLAASALGAEPEQIRLAAWVATIPLWFLTVYVAVVAVAPGMYALHRRWGLAVPVVLTAMAAAGDAARLLFDLPYGRQVQGANFVLVWLAIHQVGFAWQDGRLPARWSAALPLVAGGLGGLILLTAAGPYPVSMVAVPGAELQNTSPPTLALLCLATAQIGLALGLHDRSNRWLRRTRPWMAVVGINAVILTAFLWHLAAVTIAAVALYPTGIFPQPEIGTGRWLLWRLPWLACLAVVLALLVAAFGRIERRAGLRPDPATAPRDRDRTSATRSAPGTVLTITGLAAGVAGLVGITLAGPGYHGPTGLPAEALAPYLAGAALLRVARRRAWPK